MPNTIEIVSTWEEFREKWQGGENRQNFLLRGAMFPYQYQSPPIESVIEEVRENEKTRILRGASEAIYSMEPYSEFRQLPIEDAINDRVALAHFDSREFAGPGQVFEGLEERINGWYCALAGHGFSWNEASAQRAFFLSGPDCHTGYHFDSSYVLAWQILGRKRFCWLKEPERWCPHEVRRSTADMYNMMKRPEGITPDDVIECEMHPGDVLWNIMLTPHWVYSLDETSYSFNLTHFELRCDGQLSPIDEELNEIRRERTAEREREAERETVAA